MVLNKHYNLYSLVTAYYYDLKISEKGSLIKEFNFYIKQKKTYAYNSSGFILF